MRDMTNLKLHKTVCRDEIQEQIMKGVSTPELQKWLKEEKGINAGKDACDAYKKAVLEHMEGQIEERAKEVRERVVEDYVSAEEFLRKVVNHKFHHLNPNEITTRDAINAAKVLVEKDKQSDTNVTINMEDIVKKVQEVTQDDGSD